MSTWKFARVAIGQLSGRNVLRNKFAVRKFSTAPPAPKPVPPPRQSSTLKLALIGTTLGAAVGTSYQFYNEWTDKNAHKEHEKFVPKVLKKFPESVKITKRYINPNDKSGLEIVLFQFQTCPFCCKVRAYLDFLGLSYSVVEVDAVLRQDLKWSKYKKVPMMLVKQKKESDEGQFVQLMDSSTIISLLASYMYNRKQDIEELANFYPNISFFDDSGKKQHDIMNKYFLMFQEKLPKGMTQEDQELERKWRNWADNHLVHLISPNCYRTLDESIETFQWFSDAGEWSYFFPSWERNLMVYAGAVAMWGISKMLIRKHKLSEDVRSDIYDALYSWTNELKTRKTKFLGGQKPNLGDLSVYGVLSSMEGCEAFKDCLENTNIGEWFYAVRDIVIQNRGQLIREKFNKTLDVA